MWLQAVCTSGDAYQVMTLSAMGDAETPAGGSVCIRYAEHLLVLAQTQAPFVVLEDYHSLSKCRSRRLIGAQYFEITHKASARRCSHVWTSIRIGQLPWRRSVEVL